MISSVQDDSAVSEYNSRILIGAGVTLTVLPILIVALRFYVRRTTHTKIGPDDWMILFALVLCTVGGIVEILAATIGGMGEHQQLGSDGQLIHTQILYNYEKCRYINEIFTTLNLGVIKVSVILFYRRLFTVKPFQIAAWAMIGLVTSWTIAFTSVMAAQCNPPTDFWNEFEIDYGTNCIQVQVFYQGLAYSDLILDILVLAMPIPMVLMLKMPWRKKIAVLDVFLLGAVVLGSGVARLVSFLQVIDQTKNSAVSFYYDTLWWTAGPLFWIFAENAVAIIGASLPTLAPLWNRKEKAASRQKPYYFNSDRSGPERNTYGATVHDGQELTPENSSIRQLVGTGPTADVHAESIPLENIPSEGIRIDQTFGADRV